MYFEMLSMMEYNLQYLRHLGSEKYASCKNSVSEPYILFSFRNCVYRTEGEYQVSYLKNSFVWD